ncbi:SDR family NAD(P)-dependent oxidoreductase [Photobacterium sanctipauli]|uniref:SDR family NAD(P)-dependent oxidoreductase n=1 Tax=Photobacterium sanctipauli TaxID=1342794 RepID=A0A2T3NUM9_9GAMM|nr:SDR family oxidoreductase [Photobacterium sanctipauli]PSW19984.1 SDR family NAD(P)-dependent oxidoreductase [Photobacterium sanctipauli]
MKTLLLFGASRGLGFSIAKYYRNEGFNVIAMARSEEAIQSLESIGVQAFQGDALNKSDIEQVLSHAPKDAMVISTMGSFQAAQPVDYVGHRYLIDLLEQLSIKRFLMVTSLGCGDSWATLPERAKVAFGQAVREKTLAEAWLQTSQLDYTILRPGGLKDGEVTDTGRLIQGEEVHGLITRDEVARLTLALLEENTSIGQIYACVDPELKINR